MRNRGKDYDFKPTADDILLLKQFRHLHELISGIFRFKWPTEISANNFEVLERILADDVRRFPRSFIGGYDESLRSILGRARYHPTLDELSKLGDTPDLIENLRQYMELDIKYFLDSDISYETWLTCIRLNKTEIDHLAKILKTQVYCLVKSGELEIERLIHLNDAQRRFLANDLILEYLFPDPLDLVYEPHEGKDTPIISIDRVLALTNQEFAIISNPLYKDAIRNRDLTIDQVLAIPPQIKNKNELDAYIKFHIKFKKLMDEVLPDLKDEESREKFRGLSDDTIRKHFGVVSPPVQTENQVMDTAAAAEHQRISDRNAENVRVFLALSNQDRQKVVSLEKPPRVTSLYFIHRAMSLERVLSLTNDEMKFINEMAANPSFNATVIKELKTEGGFDRLYTKHRDLQEKLAKKEADANPPANGKFESLYGKINALEKYGESLTGRKSADVISLATNIRNQVNEYQRDPGKINEVSKNLSAIIGDGKKMMGGDRNLKDILLHIMLAATGVGLLIIVGHKIATGTFFLNKTERQRKLKEVRVEIKQAIMKKD